jgi:hypothetical protein
MNSLNSDPRNSIDGSPVLQSTRGYGSKLRFGLRACATTALLVTGLIFAYRALLYAQTPNLTGTYMADDGAIYYVQQSGNVLWWAGMSLDSGLPPDAQWHRGLNFTNVFRGTINSDNTVVGDWADVTRGTSLQSGVLTVRIDSSGSAIQLTKLTATGGFGATTWTQTGPLDDTKINGVTRDIFSRFDAVHKNDDTTLLNPNLKPYRDATVLYVRVVNTHLEYLNGNSTESEIPHVNYGPEYSPTPSPTPISGMRDFGHRDRQFSSFVINKADGDGDFDMRLKVDLNKLETNFYSVGWENHESAPDVLRLKFNDTTVRQKLNFSSSEGYSGAETIMYGRPPDCSGCVCHEEVGLGCVPGFGADLCCGGLCSINCHPDGGEPLLPGWADLSGNSVLINGRPINGLDRSSSDPSCDFNQPCPYLDGETPEELYRNYLVVPAGIRLANLLLSAYGDGKIEYDSGCTQTDGCVADGAGTYVRITGALILDCGHGATHDCFDDPSNPDEVSSHSNQEIHPVYSMDIINKPFRPEDYGVSARPNLTGAWGGNDGSTYYVRQIGNTVWFLGLLRDRQPNQQATSYFLIGTPQVAEAGTLIGNPVCTPEMRCWMFGTAFKGTISQNADGSSTISGDWAGVPQSTSPGCTGSSVAFSVDVLRKVLAPLGLGGIFPTQLQKMYEPEDTTPPQSTLTIGTPQYPTGASQPFVTSATTFTVTTTDTGSGVQNIWYRFFPNGSASPPAYTAVAGSSATFYLSGPDGLYEVDTYATDNAGNDETAHSQLVYLDNTAPVSTINQPAGTQYPHNSILTLDYNVSDGSGSGVASFTAKMDGALTLPDGHVLQSPPPPPPINLLTEMTLGSHTFSVTATDNLGNTGSNSVTFSIVVTPDSIKGDVNQFFTMGAIRNKGLANSLLAKLNAAARARARGDCKGAANIYRAFINELQAQSGKGVSPQAAAIMIADAQYLIAHCP